MNAKNAKEAGMPYKRGGLRHAEQEVYFTMPRPCPTTGHERTKSRGEDTGWTWAGKERAHGRQRADTWGEQGLEARPKRTRGGHKAVTWRTRGGQGLEARPSALNGHKADKQRTQGGHKEDTWRTRGRDMAEKLRGRGQSISRPAFFLLRENPTVNCLGNNTIVIPTLNQHSITEKKKKKNVFT